MTVLDVVVKDVILYVKEVKFYLEDKTASSCLNLALLQSILPIATRINFLKSHQIIFQFKFLRFLLSTGIKSSFNIAFQVLCDPMPATSQTSSYHHCSHVPPNMCDLSCLVSYSYRLPVSLPSVDLVNSYKSLKTLFSCALK